jgi:hypothetical protein
LPTVLQLLTSHAEELGHDGLNNHDNRKQSPTETTGTSDEETREGDMDRNGRGDGSDSGQSGSQESGKGRTPEKT